MELLSEESLVSHRILSIFILRELVIPPDEEIEDIFCNFAPRNCMLLLKFLKMALTGEFSESLLSTLHLYHEHLFSIVPEFGNDLWVELLSSFEFESEDEFLIMFDLCQGMLECPGEVDVVSGGNWQFRPVFVVGSSLLGVEVRRDLLIVRNKDMREESAIFANYQHFLRGEQQYVIKEEVKEEEEEGLPFHIWSPPTDQDSKPIYLPCLIRSWDHLKRGLVDEAMRDAKEALEGSQRGCETPFTSMSLFTIAKIRLESRERFGRVEEEEMVEDELGIEDLLIQSILLSLQHSSSSQEMDELEKNITEFVIKNGLLSLSLVKGCHASSTHLSSIFDLIQYLVAGSNQPSLPPQFQGLSCPVSSCSFQEGIGVLSSLSRLNGNSFLSHHLLSSQSNIIMNNHQFPETHHQNWIMEFFLPQMSALAFEVPFSSLLSNHPSPTTSKKVQNRYVYIFQLILQSCNSSTQSSSLSYLVSDLLVQLTCELGLMSEMLSLISRSPHCPSNHHLRSSLATNTRAVLFLCQSGEMHYGVYLLGKVKSRISSSLMKYETTLSSDRDHHFFQLSSLLLMIDLLLITSCSPSIQGLDLRDCETKREILEVVAGEELMGRVDQLISQLENCEVISHLPRSIELVYHPFVTDFITNNSHIWIKWRHHNLLQLNKTDHNSRTKEDQIIRENCIGSRFKCKFENYSVNWIEIVQDPLTHLPNLISLLDD